MSTIRMNANLSKTLAVETTYHTEHIQNLIPIEIRFQERVREWFATYIFCVDSLLYPVADLHINAFDHLLATIHYHWEHLSELNFKCLALRRTKGMKSKLKLHPNRNFYLN